jgi:hypothetical protein
MFFIVDSFKNFSKNSLQIKGVKLISHKSFLRNLDAGNDNK